MARYIVPAEMPKSCAHCLFSVLKYQHPFFSKEKPNTKGYFCPFAGLTLELDFYDYTTKADWCPLVAIEDTADVVPKSEDTVEVIRCKDCEYAIQEDDNLYTCNNYPIVLGGYNKGECFCSYGERKD